MRIRSLSWDEVAPLADGLDSGDELSAAAKGGLGRLRGDDSCVRLPSQRSLEHALLDAALEKALPASRRASLAPAAHYLFEAFRTDAAQATHVARKFRLDKTTAARLAELVEPLARECATWAAIREVALLVQESAAEVVITAQSESTVQVTIRGLRGKPPRRLLVEVAATLHRDPDGRFLLERPAHYESLFNHRIHRRRLTEEDLLRATYVDSGRAVAREGRAKLVAFLEHTVNAWTETAGAALAVGEHADLVREDAALEQHANFHRNELARISSRRDAIAAALAGRTSAVAS